MNDAVIRLDFELDDEYNRSVAAETDFAFIDHVDIDFGLMCGRVIFRVGDVVFDSPWDWLPVAGFASMLHDIVFELLYSDSCKERLNFTESADYLDFEIENEIVHVSANYCESTARVSIVELQRAAREFMHRALTHMAQEWPEATRSTEYQRRLARCTPES